MMGQAAAAFSRWQICTAYRPREFPRPRVLAIANQKGGVGKTTTAINLGAALAQSGFSTLLVDLDPQGNASTGLGIDRRSRRGGTYALLQDPSSVVPTQTSVAGLTVMTADTDLAGAEVELVTLDRREFRLREAMQSIMDMESGLQFILIDCPPSLGFLTVNAMVAADGVLVPLQCEFFALEGVGQLVQTIERIKIGWNRALTLEGIVLTMYDRRNNLSDLVASDARAFFGSGVFETMIPRNVRLSEAPSHGQPVLTYDVRSIGAQAYVSLAAELLRRRGLAP